MPPITRSRLSRWATLSRRRLLGVCGGLVPPRYYAHRGGTRPPQTPSSRRRESVAQRLSRDADIGGIKEPAGLVRTRDKMPVADEARRPLRQVGRAINRREIHPYRRWI